MPFHIFKDVDNVAPHLSNKVELRCVLEEVLGPMIFAKTNVRVERIRDENLEKRK